ncbi:helix-turn-helix transcriptional regulator [Veillonella nakazawae]|jgi:transcriptional regulator, XRE family|nr:helix-turn-helix transcriptional regulator [Veillonella nakazawae]MDK7738957.1 helix-turn-helix transcriptional regulator [Veillonella nakazawae]DAJ29863.1 MAG TPA: helix-turn-helix domain protein [Caudoviricetes sp.]DAM40023.1 MAG TPA: helix-turn-helix domain protein [Caudoviricetes sp.]
MKTMGTRLKELRMNAGYTGEEVGRMLQVSKSAISMWEKDLRSPSADLIERFADIYGVSTDYIITGRESNAPKGYYHDQEAAEYAEYLRTRPHAKILFSASKDMTKEDMEEAVRYIEYLKSKHK